MAFQTRALRRAIVSALSFLVPFTAGAAAFAQDAARSPWPDTYPGRVEALAAMETLNSALLASRSATATLEAWCADHHMADPPRVTAQRILGPDKPISAEQRARLQIGPDEPVRYRHVQLRCGGHLLSEADNWYVPGRLTPEMNRLLDTTDTPFGKVVTPLGAHRQTISADRLWSPSMDRRAAEPVSVSQATALMIPEFLFRHRAVMFDVQERPFAEVVETYIREALNFSRRRTAP